VRGNSGIKNEKNFFCIEEFYVASLTSELDESNAPNTTLSAILMMYLF